MNLTFKTGDTVLTPGGFGVVVRVRMAPPDFARPQAVHVLLDAKRGVIWYEGTVYRAEDVRRVAN